MRWRSRLLSEHHVEVPVMAIDGKLWVRISAQVYNERSDYEALARIDRRALGRLQ
jgi:isopenicillin-N epimerase